MTALEKIKKELGGDENFRYWAKYFTTEKDVTNALNTDFGITNINEVRIIIGAIKDVGGLVFTPSLDTSSETSYILQKILQNQEKQEKYQEKQSIVIKKLAEEASIAKRKRFDIWTSSKRTRSESQSFKQLLETFYQRVDPNDSNRLLCMVLNESHPRQSIIASHIWKYCTLGDGLDVFGLDFSQLNHPRNGMLLAKPIEEAFDTKGVCFMWNPLQKKIQLCVLDPGLLNKTVDPSAKTFQDINGAELQHPPNNFPFRRLLSFHAEVSLKHALARNWIDEEKYKTYTDWNDNLSNEASEPELDIDWDED